MESGKISDEDIEGICTDVGSALGQYIKFIEWIDKKTNNKRSKLFN